MPALFLSILCIVTLTGASHADIVYPGQTWERRSPEQAGLHIDQLDSFAEFMAGRGCVIRDGYLIYEWGDAAKRGDVASAVKPWNTHFLLLAVDQGNLSSLDAKLADYIPCLSSINAALGFKDREITFRHAANQTSCYGVTESPGTAFDYNDWQMALFFDALYLGVYETSHQTVDETVLHPLLTDVLECEDNPTLLAFGADHHAGRLAISPRDFARFGWFYLNMGRWHEKQLISAELIQMAVTSPLPATLPRTKGIVAEMCPDARSIGSEKIPNNQTDHFGSYSWLWWINGIDKNGKRRWPDVDSNVYAALGHRHGMRGMAVFPSQRIVVSWNDSKIGELPKEANPLNDAFRLIEASTKSDEGTIK
ncbi:MAG: hypothetical protein AMXMBFR84_44660 [Candidatus Hydrogenedentota bacterium]